MLVLSLTCWYTSLVSICVALESRVSSSWQLLLGCRRVPYTVACRIIAGRPHISTFDTDRSHYFVNLQQKSNQSVQYQSLRTAHTAAAVFFFSPPFLHLYFPASGQAVVTGGVPSPPRFLPSIFIAHRVQQSHCSSIFHRVLLTHALALSASQFVHKKKPPRIHTSMYPGGFDLTKLAYTRLEDNLIRHRGDR